jgi:hypothetical protein
MRTLVLCILLLPISYAFAENDSIWDIAHPITDLQASNDTVFSFQTPDADNSISVAYRFYTASSACTGSFSVKTYSPCVDSAHANKTYYTSEAALYQVSAAIPVTASNVKCLRQISPFATIVGGAGSCDSTAQTCSSSSEPFSTQVLASQGSCTP